MELRYFGTTGIKVSPLGYGAGNIGDNSIKEKEADLILNTVLDTGINLIDTARGYGLSEERIGKYISHRRSEFVLSTKVGYNIEGHSDWTYDIIIAGVEKALQTMKTDYIDIVHLHSCSLNILQEGKVITALENLQKSGKIIYTAYSGENENLKYAIETNRFQSVMASLNICDQVIIRDYLTSAKEKGLGFIAKRPVANAAWQYKEQPHGQYAEEYWLRLQKMQLAFPLDWQEIALRFATYTYGVDSCIVASTNIDHIKQNIAIVEKGQLPQDIIWTLHESFFRHEKNWIGQI